MDLASLLVSIVAVLLAVISIYIAIYFNYISKKLYLELENEHFADAKVINLQNNPMARYFHITANNGHDRKTAKNCRVYLISLKNESDANELLNAELPLKWRGYQAYVNIDIPAKEMKKFDAFFVFHGKPSKIQMQALVDSESMLPRANGNIRLRAKYKITADGFKDKEKEFIITLSDDLLKVKIENA